MIPEIEVMLMIEPEWPAMLSVAALRSGRNATAVKKCLYQRIRETAQQLSSATYPTTLVL